MRQYVHCRRPNYVNIYRALETLRKASKTSYEDSYEWEGKEEAIANVRMYPSLVLFDREDTFIWIETVFVQKKSMRDKQAPIGYTNAEAFFKYGRLK